MWLTRNHQWQNPTEALTATAIINYISDWVSFCSFWILGIHLGSMWIRSPKATWNIVRASFWRPGFWLPIWRIYTAFWLSENHPFSNSDSDTIIMDCSQFPQCTAACVSSTVQGLSIMLYSIMLWQGIIPCTLCYQWWLIVRQVLARFVLYWSLNHTPHAISCKVFTMVF